MYTYYLILVISEITQRIEIRVAYSFYKIEKMLFRNYSETLSVIT